MVLERIHCRSAKRCSSAVFGDPPVPVGSIPHNGHAAPPAIHRRLAATVIQRENPDSEQFLTQRLLELTAGTSEHAADSSCDTVQYESPHACQTYMNPQSKRMLFTLMMRFPFEFRRRRHRACHARSLLVDAELRKQACYRSPSLSSFPACFFVLASGSSGKKLR